METTEPPWQAIKEWIPDSQPDLDWFHRPRNPHNPDPEEFDQSPAWKAPEIPFERRPHPRPRILLTAPARKKCSRYQKNPF